MQIAARGRNVLKLWIKCKMAGISCGIRRRALDERKKVCYNESKYFANTGMFMLNNLLYSVNAVVPIFVIVLLGRILKSAKFLSAQFFAESEKFVFKVALPCMLFLEVASADPDTAFDGKLILYCVCGIIGTFLTLTLLIPLFLKDNAKRGSFIQGVYRSNFAILGVPLATNMFGDSGARTIAMVMPFTIFLFNALAVIVLSVFAPQEKKLPTGALLWKIVKNVITNPLIIAVILGIPFMLGLPMPTIMTKSVTYLSNATMALSLMALGANCSKESIQGKFRLSLSAALLKTTAMPLVMVTIAVLLGFRNEQLGTVLILFGAPTAISSYIMAKGMGADHELAGQIILFSTLLCVLTLFLFIFLLRTFALI